MKIPRQKSLSALITVGLPLLAIAAGAGFLLQSSQPAEALSGWKAGNIIDDYVMSNKSTMSVGKIQSFLNSKNPNCDTYGTQLSEYGGPDLNKDGKVQRWEWGKSRYNQTKFTCLKDYTQGGKSSAQIIYDAAQQYSINPQVLLVLLQKEQGLVKDTWPLALQYRSATGYGCPDTAACDSKYYGLTNQIKWAATMFRAIMDNSPTWYTPYELGRNYIQYNPSSSCGGSNVTIENRATQALYNYTPYQPNSGALNAGWGTAPCGAYGNRNFLLYFNSWFGSTHIKFLSMSQPRWMKTKSDVYKKIPGIAGNIDSVIPAGTEIYFAKKVSAAGNLYLQTKNDQQNGLGKGILYSDLEEISIDFVDLVSPRWMELTTDTYKVDPRTNKNTGFIIKKGTKIYFPEKTQVGGKIYLKTQHDTDLDLGSTIDYTKLAETTVEYTDLLTSRWMQTKRATYPVDIRSHQQAGESLGKSDQVYFNHKVSLNNTSFLTNTIPSSGLLSGVPISDLEEVKQNYIPLQEPRWMKTKSNTYKHNPITESQTGALIAQGTRIYYPTKITVGGKTYLRTNFGTNNGLNEGLLLSELFEDYSNMVTPRYLTTSEVTYKINPTTGEKVGASIPVGTTLYFTTKVSVGDKLFLQAQGDANTNLAILSSVLE